MIDRIRTPLDYAREVLGRLPAQGIRFDILARIEGLSEADIKAIITIKAQVPAIIDDTPAEVDSPPHEALMLAHLAGSLK